MGYLVAVIFEYLFTIYEFLYIGCMAMFGLGFFLFLLTAYEDINRNLRIINVNAKSKKKQSKIFKQLIGFIRYYSDVKQLSIP